MAAERDTRKPYTRKQIKKLSDGACYFCRETDYALLDVHRIIPGEGGGTYVWWNTVTACANCHRRIHAGEIVIDRKYLSTRGFLLHYFVNRAEFWEPCS